MFAWIKSLLKKAFRQPKYFGATTREFRDFALSRADRINGESFKDYGRSKAMIFVDYIITERRSPFVEDESFAKANEFLEQEDLSFFSLP